MSITPEFTEDQARRLIRAASVYGRELAAKGKTGDAEAKAEAASLDKARHALETAVDEAA